MSTTIVVALITATAGIIGGAVGSTLGPVVNWGVEKRRTPHENRAAKLDRWCTAINDIESNLGIEGLVEYSEMRPFLSRTCIDAVERGHITVRMEHGGNVVKDLILDDLARLEQEWGLL